MSIKILRVTDNSRLILFLLVSILLHIGILFVAPQARENKKILPRLIPIDIVEIPQLEKKEIKGRAPEIKKQMPVKERERPQEKPLPA